MELVSYSDLEKMAVVTAKSGLFGIKTPDQAAALMLIAQAEGLHPAIAARDYHIIQGKPALKADAMLARFQAAGGKIQYEEYTDKRVCAILTHPQGGTITIDWTLERAKQAGLGTKDIWRQYPRQMLRARVISEGIRTVFPGCIGSFYTPEEVQDFDVKPPTIIKTSVEVLPETHNEAPGPVIETSGNTDSLSATLKEAGDIETLRQAWESIQPEFKQQSIPNQEKVKALKDELKALLEKSATAQTKDLSAKEKSEFFAYSEAVNKHFAIDLAA